jgi:polyisoprenoid-binding protein YceI
MWQSAGRLLLHIALAVALAPGGAAAEPQRWAPITGKSHVAFGATFTLGDFEGKNERVSGEVTLDPSDLRQGATGVLRVDVGGFRTGIESRDRDLGQALQVARFPQIRFTVQQVEATFNSVSDRSDVLLTIKGLMLIRDVERPMTFPGRVRLRDDRLWVRGESLLRMTDFGISPPKRLFFSVGDQVTMRFDLTLAPE